MKSEKIPIFLSLVIVVKKENGLYESIEKLTSILTDLIGDYEIIIIDNHSIDKTNTILKALTAENGLPNLQVYRLAEEVDEYKARWVGVENSIGDYTFFIDEKINNYSLIEEFCLKIQEGNEIILNISNSYRNKKLINKSNIYKTLASLTKSFTGIDLNYNSIRYIAVSRRIINYLLQFNNPELKFRNITSIIGFKKSFVYSNCTKRHENISLRRSIARGIRLITSSTALPLRMATLISSIGAIFSFLYSVYIVFIWVLKEDVVPGWVSLSMQLSIMFFLFSIVLLIMSEYILEAIYNINTNPNFFIIEEMSSANMTRTEKLNVKI